MKKSLFLFFLLMSLMVCPLVKADDENDEWTKHLDVYNGNGLDQPVNAIEYQKTMNALDKLKERSKKKKLKKGEYPEPSNVNEPVKIEKNDIIKITTPLYYDGTTLPVGFYKVVANEDNGEYYINLVQGKTTMLQIKANLVAHSSFAPDKVNYLDTEVYQEKYFKINYKTIDYALTGYLAIVK
ncbi:MAG: hypothetical protein K6A44_06570 [bacterium]|nr:hypothetical protein [bacterium]